MDLSFLGTVAPEEGQLRNCRSLMRCTGVLSFFVILPRVHPGASGRRQGWKTPKGPPDGALLLYVWR